MVSDAWVGAKNLKKPADSRHQRPNLKKKPSTEVTTGHEEKAGNFSNTKKGNLNHIEWVY